MRKKQFLAYQDSKYKAQKASNFIIRDRSSFDITDREQVIETEHGFVVSSTYHHDDKGFTYLYFIWKGEIHRRSYKKEYAAKTVASKAREFAESIVRKG